MDADAGARAELPCHRHVDVAGGGRTDAPQRRGSVVAQDRRGAAAEDRRELRGAGCEDGPQDVPPAVKEAEVTGRDSARDRSAAEADGGEVLVRDEAAQAGGDRGERPVAVQNVTLGALLRGVC